jgi:hypothetical protein
MSTTALVGLVPDTSNEMQRSYSPPTMKQTPIALILQTALQAMKTPS